MSPSTILVAAAERLSSPATSSLLLNPSLEESALLFDLLYLKVTKKFNAVMERPELFLC